MPSNGYTFLDPDNALALLPLPASCLVDIDNALVEVNRGESGGIPGSLDKLVRINRDSRFNTKPWGRLRQGASLKFAICYSFVIYEDEEPNDGAFALSVLHHDTSQAPMLMVSLDRYSGARPPDLKPTGDTFVVSRRAVSVPLQCVIRGWGDATRGHMIYEHHIAPMDYAESEMGERFKSARYIGLTSRNWQTRYREHQRDALTGSELLFHTTLASVLPEGGIVQAGMGVFEIVRAGLTLTSELEYVNLTFDEAMQVEDKLVERTLYPAGLNMIPGGYSGVRFLHKLGLLSRQRPSLEERDMAAARYLIQLPRPSNPAPWVAEKWKEDRFYERVVLSRSNTLSREQVQQIRKFGLDWNFKPEVISRLSGASLRQVRDVLSGKYYSRVQ